MVVFGQKISPLAREGDKSAGILKVLEFCCARYGLFASADERSCCVVWSCRRYCFLRQASANIYLRKIVQRWAKIALQVGARSAVWDSFSISHNVIEKFDRTC